LPLKIPGVFIHGQQTPLLKNKDNPGATIVQSSLEENWLFFLIAQIEAATRFSV